MILRLKISFFKSLISLLFFIGIPPAVAVATEANQIVASSFSGALAHFKRRAVDLKMGLILLLGGLLGASVGVYIFKILTRNTTSLPLESSRVRHFSRNAGHE